MKLSAQKKLFLISAGTQSSLMLGKIEMADTFLTRMKGLLCRDNLTASDGMLITPCNYVHTFGMKFCIDIVFLDKDKRVIGVRHEVNKNKITGSTRAKHTLELPAGKVNSLGLKVGDKLNW